MARSHRHLAGDDPEKVILAHAKLSFGPCVPATHTRHPLRLMVTPAFAAPVAQSNDKKLIGAPSIRRLLTLSAEARRRLVRAPKPNPHEHRRLGCRGRLSLNPRTTASTLLHPAAAPTAGIQFDISIIGGESSRKLILFLCASGTDFLFREDCSCARLVVRNPRMRAGLLAVGPARLSLRSPMHLCVH